MKKFATTTLDQTKNYTSLVSKQTSKKLSVSFREVDIYNSLPSDQKIIQCKSTFRRKLKNYILTNSL